VEPAFEGVGHTCLVRSPVPIRPSWLTLASNKCQLNDSRVVAVLALSCHRSTSGRLLGASTERGRHLLPQSHNFRLDPGWIAGIYAFKDVRIDGIEVVAETDDGRGDV
jgi:hypothetical protein